MIGASLREFLDLFPSRTRRALWVACGVAAALAVLDFAALVLLYPVFGALVGGDGATSSEPVAGWRGLDSRTLLVLAMMMMILRSVAAFLNRVWWSRRVAESEVALSSRLLAAYAYAPYAFHLRRNSSDLLSRAVSHVNMAVAAGLNGVVTIAADMTTVLGLAAALFVVEPAAAALVCAYLAAIGVVFTLVSKRFVARQTERFAHQVSQVYARATTVLRGIRELTVAQGRDAALSSINSSRVDMVRAQRNMLVLTDVPRLVLEVALYSAVLVALFVALGRGEGQQSLPVIALYVVAGLRILPVIARGLGNLTQLRTGLGIGQQVAAELSEVAGAGAQEHHLAGPLPREGDLTMEGVSFAYEVEPILSDVSLAVPFGQTLAIVGPSGSGKSTLLGLLLGLLAPTSGHVLYGGSSIGLADTNWLRHVAYVPQDVFILDDTVLANVTLGDDTPDESRALEAIERASLGDVIAAMPEGLHTGLGETGSRLSVGQRQRLGLARALYRQASVLILDEPTAALDAKTEAEVMGTINSLRGEVTIVIVAHRLETIRDADAVVRLNGGSLVRESATGSDQVGG